MKCRFKEALRKIWRSMEIDMIRHFSCKIDKLEVHKKVWRSMEKSMEKYGEVWRLA